jgi:NAD-reducing hydrogenase large subunit
LARRSSGPSPAKRIHGIAAVPGGVHKTFFPEERDFFLTDAHGIPSVDTMIKWSKEIVDFIKSYHDKHYQWLDSFAHYPSGHLGLVRDNGDLELYEGRLRAIDSEGNITLNDVPATDYINYFTEGVKKWSYMKFPYLTQRGMDNGWNRVGPIARLNVCDSISTPLAQKELEEFKAYTDGKPNNSTMHSHWARLIEILHCAEEMKLLLDDESILGNDLLREGVRQPEGIGVIEAPRGTLIHHYVVDDNGMITRCNLIVSTTHNNQPMNEAVKWVAKNVLDNQKEITEGMLNQVEVAIRAYDPCLSCATHALGKMPLQLSVYDHEGTLIGEHFKNAE